MAEAGKSQAQNAPGFFSVRVAALLLHSVPEFDLFIQHTPGDPMVLFREGSTPITREDLVRLNESGVEKIFVRDVEAPAYHAYSEEHLEEALTDDKTDIKEKSRILYDVSRQALREIFDDPKTPDMVPRTRMLVESTLKVLFSHEAAFKNVMREMSFDYTLYTHSVNVSVMSITLAHTCGVDDRKTLLDIGHGALLHDIGKSMLDPRLLHCEGELTAEQWAEMKLHPIHSHDILKSQGIKNKTILDIARHHHERVCGGGYPDDLAGTEISPPVRICSICDCFDALTTRRIYQDAVSSFEALKIMRQEMDGEIDPYYFEAFVRLMGPDHPEVVKAHVKSKASGTGLTRKLH